MPRIEKKVTKEEFDNFTKTYPHPVHVNDTQSKIPPFTTTYVKGPVEHAGYDHEDLVALVRNFSNDKKNPNTEDAYYIYEEIETLNPGL